MILHQRLRHNRRPIKSPFLTARKYGFTLIELIMVTAIIGILSVIVFTMIGNMRAAANEARCASNMRQLGIALRAYANDNGNRLPHIAHGRAPEESWIFTIAEYLDNSNEVRLSPADPLYEEKRNHEEATSYLLNDFVFLERLDWIGRPDPDFPPPSFNTIDDPSRVIASATGAIEGGVAADYL